MGQLNIGERIIPGGKGSIYGKLYLPADAAEGKKYPAVILSHGFNGSGADFDFECRHLAGKGYLAYAYDFCGGSRYSKSSGRMEDMTISSETDNLRTVFSYIRALDCVDEKRIILLGASQGGLVTALAAAEFRESVAALILYFPAFCIPDHWKERFPDPEAVPPDYKFWDFRLGKEYVKEAQKIDVYARIGAFEGKVLILHGDRDQIVPLPYSECAVKCYQNAELIVYENEGHGFSPAKSTEAIETAIRWLDALE